MMNSAAVSYTSTAGTVTSPGAGSRNSDVRLGWAVARTRVSALRGRETGLMRRTMAGDPGYFSFIRSSSSRRNSATSPNSR